MFNGKWRKGIPRSWPQKNDKCYEGAQWHPLKILKEEILKEITKKFMEKIPGMVHHNVQDALKKFQDTKNKE
jgi:hypothetical protein